MNFINLCDIYLGDIFQYGNLDLTLKMIKKNEKKQNIRIIIAGGDGSVSSMIE